MTTDEWVFLLEAFDRLQAEILKEALEANGIPAELFQEGAAHYVYPVGGPLGRIEICVPGERLEEAKKWLEAFNSGEFENTDLSNPDNE